MPPISEIRPVSLRPRALSQRQGLYSGPQRNFRLLDQTMLEVDPDEGIDAGVVRCYERGKRGHKRTLFRARHVRGLKTDQFGEYFLVRGSKEKIEEVRQQLVDMDHEENEGPRGGVLMG